MLSVSATSSDRSRTNLSNSWRASQRSSMAQRFQRPHWSQITHNRPCTGSKAMRRPGGSRPKTPFFGKFLWQKMHRVNNVPPNLADVTSGPRIPHVTSDLFQKPLGHWRPRKGSSVPGAGAGFLGLGSRLPRARVSVPGAEVSFSLAPVLGIDDHSIWRIQYPKPVSPGLS